MKKSLTALAVSLCAAGHCVHAASTAGIDTVASFVPGAGQSAGQGPEYYPANIFGMPDTVAKVNVPASSPSSVLSLGEGGSIVVGWKGKVLTDGPGADFAVFENAFEASPTLRFVEPARVSVSLDGVVWHDFPWDDQTLAGCAGITPTIGSNVFVDIRQAGGDAFDIGALGLDSVRWIRITDHSVWLRERPDHPLWTPVITGFDLDAAVGFSLRESGEPVTSAESETAHTSELIVYRRGVVEARTSAQGCSLRIYDTAGRLLADGQHSTEAGHYSAAVQTASPFIAVLVTPTGAATKLFLP